MNLDVCPKVVFKKLLYLIVVLLFLNILGLISKFYFGHDQVYGLVSLFDFDTEKIFPLFILQRPFCVRVYCSFL